MLLAKGLVSEPDLLLLDEPTNHLDIEKIEWLEKYLRFSGSDLRHYDRMFLRRLATGSWNSTGELYDCVDYDNLLPARKRHWRMKKEERLIVNSLKRNLGPQRHQARRTRNEGASTRASANT